MNKTHSGGIIISIILTMLTLSSCSEKDDFIPEPTETSVIISGIVTTSSLHPLANLPIYIDYHEGYPMGSQTTLHKAKGITDSNGCFRLFFEPEPDRSYNENSPDQVYYLHVDLAALSSGEYIKPSEFDANLKDTYTLRIYRHLDKGENLEVNMIFPKKKDLDTEFRSFVSEKELTVTNSITYGAETVSIRRDVNLDSEGNGRVSMPYALNAPNVVSVTQRNSFRELMQHKEINVNEESASTVVFDNNETLENCKFRLSLYTHTAFNGDKYGNNDAFKTPAPFDFMGFRIVNNQGDYEFPTNRYQYYDSIVWSSPDLPETLRIYDKKEIPDTGSAEQLTSQWGSYFFDSGIHKSVLTGYKNGKAIHSDEQTFELKDRSFLCFDWNRFDYLTSKGVAQNVYCRLDNFFSYGLNALKEDDGTKIVRIFVKFRGKLDYGTALNWQEARLSNLMNKHLGHWIEYDKSTLKSLFKHLPDAQPVKLYENETTRAIIMLHPPTEEEEREYYYIHAEPKF